MKWEWMRFRTYWIFVYKKTFWSGVECLSNINSIFLSIVVYRCKFLFYFFFKCTFRYKLNNLICTQIIIPNRIINIHSRMKYKIALSETNKSNNIHKTTSVTHSMHINFFPFSIPPFSILLLISLTVENVHKLNYLPP